MLRYRYNKARWVHGNDEHFLPPLFLRAPHEAQESTGIIFGVPARTKSETELEKSASATISGYVGKSDSSTSEPGQRAPSCHPPQGYKARHAQHSHWRPTYRKDCTPNVRPDILPSPVAWSPAATLVACSALKAFAASAAQRHFLPTSLGFIVLAASKARVAAHTGGDFRKKAAIAAPSLGCVLCWDSCKST